MAVITAIVKSGFALWVFVFLRILGMFVTGPVYSSSRLPSRYRVAAALVLSIVPVSSKEYQWVCSDNGLTQAFLFACAGELLLGAITGLVTSLFLESYRLAGSLMDFGCRTLTSTAPDPITEEEDGLFARLAMMCAFLIFLWGDLHHLLIKGIYQSFTVFPPGMVAIAEPGENLTRLIISAGGCIFSTALAFAVPPLFLLFLFQILLNVISFTVPSMSDAFSDTGLRAVVSMGFSVSALFFASAYVMPLIISAFTFTGLDLPVGQ